MKIVAKLTVFALLLALAVAALPGRTAAQAWIEPWARRVSVLEASDDLEVVDNDDDASVRVEPMSSTVSNGEIFTVDVTIESVENLSGYEFKLDFDPDIVEIMDVMDGGFFGEAPDVVLGPQIGDGNVTFGAFMEPPYNGGATGSGLLATVTLEAVGIGTSPLDLQKVSLFNTVPEEIPVIVFDGMVEVTPCVPVEVVSLTSDSPVEVGQAMHFTATVTGSETINYAWGFGGDGTASDEETATPTFVYDEAGSYTGVFTVTNACSVATDTLEIEVEPACEPVEVVSLASDSPVTLREAMHFTATVSGSEPITYAWDFGGAGTASGEETATPTFTYDAAGEYTVAFTATNVCGMATDTLTVEVEPGCEPVAIVSVDSDSPVALGGTVHFTATVTGDEPISYTWDFGGIGTASGEETATPSFTYDAVGEYTVTLTVENCGGTAQDTLDAVVVEVTPCVPVALDALVSEGPVTLGEAMHLTATVSGSEPITYVWDFGGAGTASGEETATPAFTYGAAGEYTVAFTATNFCGTVTDTLVVEVEPACDPVEIFSVASDSPVKIGQTMHFTATVTGTTPYTYTWDFGGAGSGVGLSTATPTWTYIEVDAYTVSLTAQNPCGRDDTALGVVVEKYMIFMPITAKDHLP